MESSTKLLRKEPPLTMTNCYNSIQWIENIKVSGLLAVLLIILDVCFKLHIFWAGIAAIIFWTFVIFCGMDIYSVFKDQLKNNLKSSTRIGFI
jgi:hypothetical protein